MTCPANVKPRCRTDLLLQFNYIAENSGLKTALRFRDAVIRTFEMLASHPLLGSPHISLRGSTKDIRRYPVRGFEKYLIFYLPKPGRNEIVRVLHGAQDIDAILTEEEEQ